jgi:hypothetical protein
VREDKLKDQRQVRDPMAGLLVGFRSTEKLEDRRRVRIRDLMVRLLICFPFTLLHLSKHPHH